MVEKSVFDKYLSHFNTRDYDGLLKFWDDDCIVRFAGYVFRGKQQFRDFYTFFHEYVNENILVDAFLSNDSHLMLEARVNITGRKAINAAQIAAAGYENIKIPPVGLTLEIPQFIHYEIKNSKFMSVNCVICDEPKIIN